ncbi:hypothetical protein GH714_023023 [Hevea brasiliensis]|uniref:Protein kinase domain-containing protein n=1 Tax=Hevea brasiliensis TaxID=3981 RepID=A0A6A6KCJ0_HEVBR|nr:hypothetical protein GH714_023023 [Hevea brasiliensis]
MFHMFNSSVIFKAPSYMGVPILKYQKLLSSIISLLLIVSSFVFAKTFDNSCILDIHLSPSIDDSDCIPGNWGGFINNNCCGAVFYEYIYALGKRANITGQIYLNSAEQKACLISMKRAYNDVEDCGIEKLTGGEGGCSSYTKADVSSKLGNRMNSLDEDCMLINSDDKHDQNCRACLRRWEEIGGSPNKSDMNSEANMCRFAVLITLTSNMIDDNKRVQAIYNCLGLQNLSVGNGQGGNSQSGDTKQRTGILVLITGLVGLGALTCIAVSVWIFCRKRTKENLPTTKNGSYDSCSEPSNNLKISPKEIYLATNNLNEANFVGQGVAGKVYRGILSNGQHVAVKHIINDGQMETFVREVTSLSHIRHPNLVALLGFCEHKDEYFLVYELCKNGNLSEWLYGKDRVLSWIQRLVIAIDSARGLWFLHSYPEGCIVHRDVKPTNILINAKFQAKLSDFGLSKVMDVGQSYVSSEVRGTFGYVDPEYRQNHHVNAKGDVYSFGIVLLQLISGQRVINLNLNRPMQLNKMAKFLSRGGNITEFADPKLSGEYSVEAFDLVIKLALSCTGIKQERPSMEKVVLRLENALEISMKMKSITYG